MVKVLPISLINYQLPRPVVRATTNPRDNSLFSERSPLSNHHKCWSYHHLQLLTSWSFDHTQKLMEPLHLPNLEERTLARFDELARQEKIFYEEAVSELITVNGFDVSLAVRSSHQHCSNASSDQETHCPCNPRASTHHVEIGRYQHRTMIKLLTDRC